MHDAVSLILAIFGALLTWTASVATLSLWLASKFRSLERLVYREMNLHEQKDQQRFTEHMNRLTVLELKGFGASGITEAVVIKEHR